ncbi:MAG: hypothetical protein WA001_00655 [Patescibacteria group bacterium]
MESPRTSLPADFVDRPWPARWRINIQILLRRRAVKRVCCESFRKDEFACKGCATLYDVNSSSAVYRFLGKWAKRRDA